MFKIGFSPEKIAIHSGIAILVDGAHFSIYIILSSD
jgi:hypothetical protein